MEKTEWRGQSKNQIREEKRSGRLVGAAEASKELAEWRRLQSQNLSILGLLKRNSGLNAIGRAVGKYDTAAFAKRERNKPFYLEHQIIRRAFDVREEMRRAAAEQTERDEYSCAKGQ